MKYTIGLGITTFTNIPMQHPIAILNAGVEKIKSPTLAMMDQTLYKL